MTLVNAAAQEQVESKTPIGNQIGESDPFTLVSLNTDYMDMPEQTNSSSRGGGDDEELDSLQGRIGNLRRVKVTAQFDVPLPESTLGGFMYDIVQPILQNTLPPLQESYAIESDPTKSWESGATATNTRVTRNTRNTQQPTRRGTTRSSSGSSSLKIGRAHV